MWVINVMRNKNLPLESANSYQMKINLKLIWDRSFTRHMSEQSQNIAIIILVQKIQLSSFSNFFSDDRKTLHNREAPTRQNLLCDSKSVWEIIRNHEDYLYGANNRPMSKGNSKSMFFYSLILLFSLPLLPSQF